MILDLESQKLVNRVQGCLIVGPNRDLCATGSLLQIPMKLIFESSHGRRAGYRRAVNQHCRVEIPVREHLRDVVKMTSDLIAALGVLDVIGADIDDAAVVVQLEMMSSLVMREAHDVVTMFVHRGLVIL